MMGEYAHMILNGSHCQGCGAYLGEAVGYGRNCERCAIYCGEDTPGYPKQNYTGTPVGTYKQERSRMKEECITTAQFDLHAAGFSWRTNDKGIHLQVYRGKKRVADLWPTTGRWSIYAEPKRIKGYGVTKLIDKLNQGERT